MRSNCALSVRLSSLSSRDHLHSFRLFPPTPTFLHYRNSVRTICYSFQTISIILLYSLYNLLHFLAHDPLKNFPIPYASACNPVSFSSVNFARMLLLWFSDDFHLKDSFFFVENLSSKVFERFWKLFEFSVYSQIFDGRISAPFDSYLRLFRVNPWLFPGAVRVVVGVSYVSGSKWNFIRVNCHSNLGQIKFKYCLGQIWTQF